MPTSKFEVIDRSFERHGTLYRCLACGQYIEVIAEERSPRFTAVAILRRHYSKLGERDG